MFVLCLAEDFIFCTFSTLLLHQMSPDECEASWVMFCVSYRTGSTSPLTVQCRLSLHRTGSGTMLACPAGTFGSVLNVLSENSGV